MPANIRSSLKPYLRKERRKWFPRGTYPVKEDGAIVRKTGFLGAGSDTRAACQADCDRLNAELEAEATAGDPEPTFEDAALVYLRNGGEGRFLHDRLLDEIGQLPANAIDDAVMTKAAAVIYPNCTPETVNRQLYTPVIRVLRMASKGRSWKPDLERPRGYAKRKRRSPPDNAWFDLVKPECNPRLWALLMFGAIHGRRGGDAVRCKPGDFDPKGRTVFIPKTKNGDALMVQLADTVFDALMAYNWQEGPGLFGSYFLRSANPNVTSCRNLFRDLKAACVRAGVKYYTPHEAGRHAFAKRGLEAGWSLAKLKEGGHWKTIRMPAELYNHLEQKEVDRDARDLGEEWAKGLGQSQDNVVPLKKSGKNS